MNLQLISIDLSPSAIEFEASKLLREAFKDRGLAVRHNGSSTTHAPGGKPDIELFNDDIHINFEITKLMRVAQTNQEATPVAAHLDEVAEENPAKKVLMLSKGKTGAYFISSLFNEVGVTTLKKTSITLGSNWFPIQRLSSSSASCEDSCSR